MSERQRLIKQWPAGVGAPGLQPDEQVFVGVGAPRCGHVAEISDQLRGAADAVGSCVTWASSPIAAAERPGSTATIPPGKMVDGLFLRLYMENPQSIETEIHATDINDDFIVEIGQRCFVFAGVGGSNKCRPAPSLSHERLQILRRMRFAAAREPQITRFAGFSRAGALRTSRRTTSQPRLVRFIPKRGRRCCF